MQVIAYKTYIRPILEYATEVFNPDTVKLKKKLEKIQRTFTKKVLNYKGIKNLSYQERLTMCQLDSLEIRRSQADLITTFKILSNHYNIDPSVFFEPPRRTNSRLHHRLAQSLNLVVRNLPNISFQTAL